MNVNFTRTRIIEALQSAVLAHLGQTRKLSGAPYVQHPIQVAMKACELGYSETTIQACLLHDVVEDTPTTIEDVYQKFGCDVANLVALVTKSWPADTPPADVPALKLKYYQGIAENPGAITIKLLDRSRNLNDMTRDFQLNPRWSADYYSKTVAEFGILLRECRDGHVPALKDFAFALRCLYAKADKFVPLPAPLVAPEILLSQLPESLKSVIISD